jgi:predicted ribosome quality control (RQC) complex YloA/Tae2 family protein
MLSFPELQLLVRELGDALHDSRVQKISGPDPERLAFEFFGGTGKQRLLVVLSGPHPRLHLSTAPVASAPKPYGFVELLRKELVGARLHDVRVLDGDRIVRFAFQTLTEGRPDERLVFIEIFPRNRNLVLTDGSLRILGILRNRAGGAVPLAPGETYQPPPPRPDQGRELPTPFAFLGDVPTLAGGLSPALEAWAAPRELAAAEEDLRRDLGTELRKRLKKERRTLEALQADMASAAEGERHRRLGELLKHNLASIEKGASSVTLTDWSEGIETSIEVALDPRLSARAIMEQHFKKAKKLDRSLPKVAARAGTSEERVAAITELLEQVESADADALPALWEQAAERGWVRSREVSEGSPEPASRAKGPAPRKPYRRFVSKDGIEILVGRTASDNDELSLRIGRGNEVWMHVADYPGSHVVIRTAEDPSPETLLDAATLAVHFSQAPKGGRVDVHRTHCKYVSKFRGARPGQVQLAKYKSMRMRAEPERLDRLVNSRDDPG